MSGASDIAVVGFAQTPSVRRAADSEVQMLVPVVAAALQRAGVDRRDIGFTCAGSCDYLTGGPFAFVSNLEAAGAWPPISESHVEMDGAWALYEAWVRLQHGDIDTALVFGSGKSSPSKPAEVWAQQLDPYYLAPLGVDPLSLAGLQARVLLDRGKATERDFAEVVVRSRRQALDNPNAQVRGNSSVDELLAAAIRARTSAPTRPAAYLRRRGCRRARPRRSGAEPVRASGVDTRARPSHRGPSTRYARPRDFFVDDARGTQGRI